LNIALQISISVLAAYTSYMMWKTDSHYQLRQEEIALADRSKKLDEILSEMYIVLRKIQKLRYEVANEEIVVMARNHIIFDPTSTADIREKTLSKYIKSSDRLGELYEEISHQISLLRMKYGIYFSVLQQQFAGASNPIQISPKNEYKEWNNLRIKMLDYTFNLKKLDFCLSRFSKKEIMTSNKHIDACKKYKPTPLSIAHQEKIPVYSSLQNIIETSGDLLQIYADKSFENNDTPHKGR